MMLQIFDSYEIKARIAPAIMALIPLIAFAMHGIVLQCGESFTITVSTLIFFAGLFAFSLILRNVAKAKERALWKAWGGNPAAIVLFRAGLRFERGTLAIKQTMLRRKFQKPEDTTAGSLLDMEYATILIKRLIEATRDRKDFSKVFAGNYQYGFWRNLFAARTWIIASGCAITCFSALLFFLDSSFSFFALFQGFSLSPM